MVTEPGKAFIMGGTYRIPVLTGMLGKNFFNDLKRDPTFNEAGFEREYSSKWTGTIDGAFFNGDKIDRNRILNQPEYEHSGRSSDQAYYVIGVDVGRKGCQSVATIIKVSPQANGSSMKSLVNIYVFGENDLHFEDQAILLKKLYYRYKAKRLVIDGNGLGIGLMDYMVKRQITEDGEMYPPFGVYGGTYADAD
jgi:hypothetical protein